MELWIYFSGGQPIPYNEYQVQYKTMLLNDISCHGNESSISQCTQTGEKDCRGSNIIDARVNCMSGKGL